MAPRLDKAHLTKIFPFIQYVEDQLIICIRSHEDLKFTIHDHIQVFARVTFTEQDIARIQVDDIHLRHQTIQFFRRKVGKKGDLSKQVRRHIFVIAYCGTVLIIYFTRIMKFLRDPHIEGK
jgi:hypothetical protein